jgi:hypothetical protein
MDLWVLQKFVVITTFAENSNQQFPNGRRNVYGSSAQTVM